MTEQDAAFERCVDFLVRMMNKYGKEFLEDMEKKGDTAIINQSDKTEGIA
jgi:hypothetical protein